jgi:hypothetical protein
MLLVAVGFLIGHIITRIELVDDMTTPCALNDSKGYSNPYPKVFGELRGVEKSSTWPKVDLITMTNSEYPVSLISSYQAWREQ